jgi:hypothetical protein
MKSNTVLKTITIIALLLLVGYSRDFIFKSINALIKANDSEMDYFLHPSLTWLTTFSNATLIKIKWIFTILFSLVFLLIGILALKFLFKNKNYSLILILAYSLLFSLSAVLFGLGVLFKNSSIEFYEAARYFMGMLQSPLIIMILIPLFILYKKSEKINGDTPL